MEDWSIRLLLYVTATNPAVSSPELQPIAPTCATRTTSDIAGWSQQHVRELARVGRGYGVELDPEPEDESTLLARLKQRGAELVGRHHEPSLLLLADLRHVHRVAAGVSLDWEVLAQTAQAMKDHDLLAVAQECHPHTLRQMKWANAQLKVSAAQVMVTG